MRHCQTYLLVFLIILCTYMLYLYVTEIPAPVPIELPRSQYRHLGGASEWWWHTGTVQGDDEKLYGIVINNAIFKDRAEFQLSIGDEENDIYYYYSTKSVDLNRRFVASTQPGTPWFVSFNETLFDNGQRSNMKGVNGSAMNVNVNATFKDTKTGINCGLYLNFQQEATVNPLLVWENGYLKINESGETDLQVYNYYYSLVHLETTGYLILGDRQVKVKGMTWMDHEFGVWSDSQVSWILQNLMLDNGVRINHWSLGNNYTPGKEVAALTSIRLTSGRTITSFGTVTPYDPIPNTPYFGRFDIRIKVEAHDIDAAFTLVPRILKQIIVKPDGNQIYEGFGKITKGIYNGKDISGTVWIEQSLFN